MTDQQVFDKVAKHAMKKQKSEAANGFCQYRGPNGARCFVGVLIKNRYYRPSLDGKTPEDTPVLSALRASGVKSDAVFLGRIQTVHDNWDPKFWARELRVVARSYGLSFTVLRGVR